MINEKDRIQSERILALNIGCSPETLKNTVFDKFASYNVSVEEFKNIINKYKATKKDQAQLYNMHPDDTPAGLMVEMLEEYFPILKTHKKSNIQILSEIEGENPDLLEHIISAIGSGDMETYRDLIAQNPEFLDSFMGKLADNELADNVLVDNEEKLDNDIITLLKKIMVVAQDASDFFEQKSNKQLKAKDKFELLMFILFYSYKYLQDEDMVKDDIGNLLVFETAAFEEAKKYDISLTIENFHEIFHNRYLHYKKEIKDYLEADQNDRPFLPHYFADMINYEEMLKGNNKAILLESQNISWAVTLLFHYLKNNLMLAIYGQ